jgi:dipeptidyl aminopeptidase/acylaminoacyl peptidase
MGDCQARICEGLGVKFPGPTRRQPIGRWFWESPGELSLQGGRRTAYFVSKLASIVLGSVLVSNGELGARGPAHQSTREPSGHSFAVKDSIEMARFERTGGEPKFSPDKKYFAVVTSRGLLESNETESTLWIFQSNEAKKLLWTDDVTKRGDPKILARLAAVPQVQYFTSYEPVITDLQWLPDSKTILFLGQDSQGERLLYEANVVSGSFRALTAKGHDVLKFEFVGGNIAYEATRPNESRNAGELINPTAWDVTGVRLTSILFPQTDSDQKEVELWALRNGDNRGITDPNTGRPVHLKALPPPRSVLSLSSSGQSVVALVPTKTIPVSWESYQPEFAHLKLHSNDSDMTSVLWPAQYAVIDLKSGQTTSLVRAPIAWTLGSADVNQAVWSSNEKKLLLTNTYLPLDRVDESERTKRLHHCVAAVVELASKESSCVVFSTYNGAKKHLLASSFGESDKEVVLRFWNAPNTTTEERYQYDNGAWRPASLLTGREQELPDKHPSESGLQAFSVSAKQDLNTPPALWATDRENGRSKKIWDPNPQLAGRNLGEASEFRWEDKSGYEWIGGLVKPPDYISGKRYPLVIQTHGFQANEFITDGAFTTAFAARPLASAGMVVLQIPTRHDHMGSREEALDQIAGYESAVERLAAEGLIDPEKVGIIGFSRTCYYVESALIKAPKRFAAASIADGVDESYMTYLLFGVGRSQDEKEQIYGSSPFGDGLKTWIEHAPGFHLDRIQAPLLIEAIKPGSVLQEWEIYASLVKQKKAVALIYLPDGQHILQKPLERLASQQGNVDWLRFWLKGEEDSDPAKAAQYARWRDLRKLKTKNQESKSQATSPGEFHSEIEPVCPACEGKRKGMR